MKHPLRTFVSYVRALNSSVDIVAALGERASLCDLQARRASLLRTLYLSPSPNFPLHAETIRSTHSIPYFPEKRLWQWNWKRSRHRYPQSPHVIYCPPLALP